MFSISRRLKKLYHLYTSYYAARYYKNPGEHLNLIGVTGTSGKSTTSTMIFHLLKENGYKVGLISTVGAIAGDEKIDTGFHVTTPDARDMQKLLYTMREKGMEYVIVETSSHALDQGRLGFLKFKVAVFTHIKRDHLDYHQTWEEYARAKCRLIDHLEDNGTVVFNFDDQKSYKFIKEYIYLRKKIHNQRVKEIEYSVSQELKDIIEDGAQLNFKYKNYKFEVPVIGIYNTENALAAINVAQILRITTGQVAIAFKSFKNLSGRMEIMQEKPFLVIVDFAHNTDSLERSLKAIERLRKRGGRIITVFGSAGLRDVEKRFDMGQVSGKLSDITIITAEDPRTESLEEINSEIIRGAESSGAKLIRRFKNTEDYNNSMNDSKSRVVSKEMREEIGMDEERERIIYSFDEENVNSRFDAIQFAVRLARAGDIIITEGKGHEQSLSFGVVEYPFTDQEAVLRALDKIK